MPTDNGKLRILFCGRKQVAAQALDHLIHQSDVEVVGVMTDNHLSVSPTSDLARSAGIPVIEFEEALERSANGSLQFDLGISVVYWRRIRGSLLAAPRLGFINFHPAPLPEYKGTAGYNLAILEGRGDWGVSVHYMDDMIDTGGIIEVASFPIDRDRESVLSLERRSAEEMSAQFLRVVGRIRASRSMLPTLPNVGGRHVSRSQMESMKKVVAGDDVPRKIRAFWYPPYDGAYVEIEGQKFTLADRRILQSLADPARSTLFTGPSGAGS
jgi:methionyl-tRNA formyltransferase